MIERRAETLLEVLFDQLDALSTLDMKDDYQVANACKANAAVNSTVRTVLDVVECSMKAANDKGIVASKNQVRGFFGDGEVQPNHLTTTGGAHVKAVDE